jgi:hypothetical protein
VASGNTTMPCHRQRRRQCLLRPCLHTLFRYPPAPRHITSIVTRRLCANTGRACARKRTNHSLDSVTEMVTTTGATVSNGRRDYQYSTEILALVTHAFLQHRPTRQDRRAIHPRSVPPRLPKPLLALRRPLRERDSPLQHPHSPGSPYRIAGARARAA